MVRMMPIEMTDNPPKIVVGAKDELGLLRLSVVIPTYNRRESLLRTLDALAKQTYPMKQFEVVIISDGASDGTADAVKTLTTPYRLRFIEQANAGPAKARNNGARSACAPLIVYVDDDIEPLPDFLAEHAKAHENDPKLVLIGPQSEPVGEPMDNWVRWEHRMLQKQYDNFNGGVWEAGPNNLYSGNFSLRREHLLAVGGFNEQFTRQEDVELGFRLAAQGLHFLFSMKANALHRPTRPFQSWVKTPFEYGRRDVQMARDGGEARAMELARQHYGERNLATRAAAKLCIGRPALESLVLGASAAVIKAGGPRLAMPACSLLFNLRYLQGMCQELGGRRKLWQAINNK